MEQTQQRPFSFKMHSFCAAKWLLSLLNAGFILQTSHLLKATQVSQVEFIMERQV